MEACLGAGDSVLATGRADSMDGFAKSFSPSKSVNLQIAPLDICDESQIREMLAKHQPDVLYHLAALTFLPQVERERKAAFDVNVTGTMALLDAARAHPAMRVLFVSSAQIYQPSETPISESGAFVPSSFYGMTKRLAEEVAFYYSHHGVQVMVARPFNHSGPGQRPEFVLPSFAKQIADAERGIREPKIRVGNLNAVRDFLHVRDVVAAYRALATSGRSGEVYNVCSGEGRTIWSALMGLVSRAKVGVEVEVDPDRLRAGDAKAMVGDATKIRTETGWLPALSFDDLLDDLIKDARS